jgi:hypothetical protein
MVSDLSLHEEEYIVFRILDLDGTYTLNINPDGYGIRLSRTRPDLAGLASHYIPLSTTHTNVSSKETNDTQLGSVDKRVVKNLNTKSYVNNGIFFARLIAFSMISCHYRHITTDTTSTANHIAVAENCTL